MQKSFVITAFLAFCSISVVACKGEANSELQNAAIQIIDNLTFGKILTAALSVLGILSVVIYQFILSRERRDRQILNLEIDHLTKQHNELSEKYKNALAIGSDELIDSQDQQFFKKIIKTVEDNIGDPEFKVERMAKEIGMSRTNLYRRLKAITGFPPSGLLRNIRLQKAAELLLCQAESVSQIGYIVGFEDHSYFSKAFKKEFGVPPSEYLRSKRQSNLLNHESPQIQERMNTLASSNVIKKPQLRLV